MTAHASWRVRLPYCRDEVWGFKQVHVLKVVVSLRRRMRGLITSFLFGDGIPTSIILNLKNPDITHPPYQI